MLVIFCCLDKTENVFIFVNLKTVKISDITGSSLARGKEKLPIKLL